MALSVLLVSLAAGQAFEWSGVFKTPKDSYTWIAQKATGTPKDYADPTMKLMAVSTAGFAKSDLEALHASANTKMLGDCTVVNNGETITPSTSACYKLTFDASVDETTFVVDTSGAENIAFFGEHFPTEFEDTKHYFKDGETDIEPEAEAAPTSFEWYGIFETPKDSYTWIAQKATGTPKDYADPTMILVAIPATAATDAAMKALVTTAKGLYATTCTVVNKGETITASTNACYKLTFDASVDETTFVVDTSDAANVAFFAQHFPTEFEVTKHYFKDGETDIEPAAQESVVAGASHSHGAGSIEVGGTCACEQTGNFPFTIDCSAAQVIRDAMATMGTCEKSTCKTNSACQTAFFVIQAHHDHCDHDTLTYEEEAAMHDFETSCTNCQIYRKYKPGNVDCHFMPADAKTNCADPSVSVSAMNVLSDQCTKGASGTCCESEITKGAFATIVAYHDLCDPSDVPQAVEMAFHDYEKPCANHFCNMIGADYDGTKCATTLDESRAALFGLVAAAALAA